VLFLLETESAYVDFIKRNQKVELRQIETELNEDTTDECLQCMRQMQQKDRLMFDKANRAFVSYVQAYSKHECNLILQLKDIDLGKLAMGFGLLKMPKMPELKGKNVSSFVGLDIDVNTISYAHEQRELHRIKKLSEYQKTGIWINNQNKCKRKQAESWSETKKRKLERQEKRSKRKEKKELKQQFSITSNKKRRKRINEEDIEQLAKDVALIKKFKKKKVTSRFFYATKISHPPTIPAHLFLFTYFYRDPIRLYLTVITSF